MMKSTWKSGIILAISLLVLLFAPLRLKAEEPTDGTIIISVVDEVGEGISGRWYLHKGNSEKSYLVRNGSFGEKFQMEAGYYYLEVRGLPHDHSFYLLHSVNPQILYGGASVVFNVQYFETEEQMLTASGYPPVAQNLEMGGTVEPSDDVFDEHGCNSTQGYAWCARDQYCTKYWSPACKVSAGKETAETPTPVIVQSVASDNSVVPALEPPPAPIEPKDMSAVIEPTRVLNLAQTGISTGFLLIVSILLSLSAIYRTSLYRFFLKVK